MSNIVFQSELAMKLQHHPKSTSPEKLLFSTANQALCDGLKNISEICYTKLLNQCYDAHDAYFHYMHMIEELKTAGILLAMHLLPIHANSNNVDILKCQVFQENSPFQNNSQVVVALAVVVSFLLLGKYLALLETLTCMNHSYRYLCKCGSFQHVLHKTESIDVKLNLKVYKSPYC